MKTIKERLELFDTHFETIDTLRYRLNQLNNEIDREVQSMACMSSLDMVNSKNSVLCSIFEAEARLNQYSDCVGEIVNVLERRAQVETSDELKNPPPRTKLDELLQFIGKNPGCTRKQIIKGTSISTGTLNMYLSAYYGYKEGSTQTYGMTSSMNRQKYFSSVDFKPVKGRIIASYYLNKYGKLRTGL